MFISKSVIEKLQEERTHQHNKFGASPIASNEAFLSILTEELGEIARCINMNQTGPELEKEIIQAAAICIAHLDGDLHFGKGKA